MNIKEKYELALLQLLAYSDNEFIIVDGITLNINEELAELRRLKNQNDEKELFILYQTDRHLSKSSRVCFGVYDSEGKAEFEANQNSLTEYESEIHIEPCILNKFEEL
jgi:hypothetical protein